MTETERNRAKFFPNIEIPRIPKGMIAVRFHGRLALIPERGKGESLRGNSPFTESQFQALVKFNRKVKVRKLKSDPSPNYTLHYQG